MLVSGRQAGTRFLTSLRWYAALASKSNISWGNVCAVLTECKGPEVNNLGISLPDCAGP